MQGGIEELKAIEISTLQQFHTLPNKSPRHGGISGRDSLFARQTDILDLDGEPPHLLTPKPGGIPA